MNPRLRRPLVRLREFVQTQEQLYERQQLLDRPWEEEFLHWCWNGQRWQLHGHLRPPHGRRRSTTRDGWCPYRTSRTGSAPRP